MKVFCPFDDACDDCIGANLQKSSKTTHTTPALGMPNGGRNRNGKMSKAAEGRRRQRDDTTPKADEEEKKKKNASSSEQSSSDDDAAAGFRGPPPIGMLSPSAETRGADTAQLQQQQQQQQVDRPLVSDFDADAKDRAKRNVAMSLGASGSANAASSSAARPSLNPFAGGGATMDNKRASCTMTAYVFLKHVRGSTFMVAQNDPRGHQPAEGELTLPGPIAVTATIEYVGLSPLPNPMPADWFPACIQVPRRMATRAQSDPLYDMVGCTVYQWAHGAATQKAASCFVASPSAQPLTPLKYENVSDEIKSLFRLSPEPPNSLTMLTRVVQHFSPSLRTGLLVPDDALSHAGLRNMRGTFSVVSMWDPVSRAHKAAEDARRGNQAKATSKATSESNGARLSLRFKLDEHPELMEAAAMVEEVMPKVTLPTHVGSAAGSLPTIDWMWSAQTTTYYSGEDVRAFDAQLDVILQLLTTRRTLQARADGVAEGNIQANTLGVTGTVTIPFALWSVHVDTYQAGHPRIIRLQVRPEFGRVAVTLNPAPPIVASGAHAATGGGATTVATGSMAAIMALRRNAQ